MDKPKAAGLTAASQETVRTMARLQSDLDLAKAENVRLRANTTIDWTPEINRLRNEVVPAIEAERDEALARCAELSQHLKPGTDIPAIQDRARDMLEVVDAAVKMYEECPPDSPRSVTEWRGYWRELGAAVAHYSAIRGEQ